MIFIGQLALFPVTILPIKAWKIYYRNFKNVNEKNFLDEVKNTDFSFNSNNSNQNYELVTNVFSNIVNKHASLK